MVDMRLDEQFNFSTIRAFQRAIYSVVKRLYNKNNNSISAYFKALSGSMLG